MLEFLYKKSQALATIQIFGILLFVAVLFSVGFQLRNKALVPQNYKDPALGAGNGSQLCPDFRSVDPLDGRHCGYTPAEAHKFFATIGEGGRWLYAISEVTLDLAFPIIYTSWFLLLMVAFWNNRYFLLAPLGAGAFDLLENFTAAYLALSFQDDVVSQVAQADSLFTVTKWALVGVSALIIIAGMLRYIWQRIFRKTTGN